MSSIKIIEKCLTHGCESTGWAKNDSKITGKSYPKKRMVAHEALPSPC